MIPLDDVRHAIEKLIALKNAATAGAWGSVPDDGWWLEGVRHRVVRGPGLSEVAFTNDANAELISTLHSTIDAQLAILRHAVERYELRGDTIALARAINGVIA